MTAFHADDIEKEYERLTKLGVQFSMRPTKLAVLDNTYGNHIQLVQVL